MIIMIEIMEEEKTIMEEMINMVDIVEEDHH